MKHLLLFKAYKKIVVILLDNARYIISKMLYILFNVNQTNQWYLCSNETSRDPVCFNVVCPHKYFKLARKEKETNLAAEREHL